MNIQMTYSDNSGETHFGELELTEVNAAAGPPPNPVGRMADLGEIKSAFIFHVPHGTFVPMHNAPHAYLAVCLSGALELVVSDGEVRRLGPGDVIAMGDLHGKGHSTRALVDSVTLFIHRAAH